MEQRINSKLIKYEESSGKNCIFISYQRKSLDFVIELSKYLEEHGIKTWYAPRNIRFGANWPEKLYKSIKNSRALLLLYTIDADKSKHVIREVSIADDENKPILWLKLDNSLPSYNLRYYLKLIHTIEYNDINDAFDALCKIFSNDVIDVYNDNSIVTTKKSVNELLVYQWTQGIYAFDTEDEAAECAARVFFKVANLNPNKTILLPTGRSGKRIFAQMIKIASSEYSECPFGNAKIMNDTETFGVSINHITSRVKGINDNLISILKKMNLSPSKEQLIYYGMTDFDSEPEKNCLENLKNFPPSVYGVSISPFLEIMGYDLGKYNDDIINDGPRVVEVSDETLEYIDIKQKSHSIYTIGLKTALETPILMILAFEKDKKNAIERLFKGNIDSSVPLTLLRYHQNAFVIITKKIADLANLTNYAVSNLSPKEAAECITNKN